MIDCFIKERYPEISMTLQSDFLKHILILGSRIWCLILSLHARVFMSTPSLSLSSFLPANSSAFLTPWNLIIEPDLLDYVVGRGTALLSLLCARTHPDPSVKHDEPRSQEGFQLLSELIEERMRREELNFNHHVIIGLFEVFLDIFFTWLARYH